jgi:hypothetical protein
MAAPRSLHYTAVLRILRYLKGTLFHGLHFSSQSLLTLQAYSDADWQGTPPTVVPLQDIVFFLTMTLFSLHGEYVVPFAIFGTLKHLVFHLAR